MTEKINIPPGYKNSPLGIIPEEWEVKRLGEICTHFKSGTTITAKEITEEGLYPVYGGNGLRGYSNTYTHNGEYILIGRQGALCGNINLVCGKSYISEHAIAVQTDEDMRWLRYKLENWNLNRFSESSAQPGLSVEKLVRYKLTVPTLNEQIGIATILQLWDTAIEKQSELIEKLKLRKRALMQQLLTGKKRLPGFSGEWKEVKLGDIVSFSTQTIETAKIYKERYVGTENMLSDCNGIILYDKDIPYIQVREYKDGDILMSNIRPYLKKIWLSNCDGGCSTDIHVIRNKVNERVNTKFLYYVLMLDTFFEYAMSGAKGSKMPRGDANMLTKYPICYPPITEQLAIINILTDADKEIELAKEKLASLQSQKQGLMQQLLTGKKRIMQL